MMMMIEQCMDIVISYVLHNAGFMSCRRSSSSCSCTAVVEICTIYHHIYMNVFNRYYQLSFSPI